MVNISFGSVQGMTTATLDASPRNGAPLVAEIVLTLANMQLDGVQRPGATSLAAHFPVAETFEGQLFSQR
jgi:hypothetical protein